MGEGEMSQISKEMPTKFVELATKVWCFTTFKTKDKNVAQHNAKEGGWNMYTTMLTIEF